MFVIVGELFFKEWSSSITVALSYVFYMVVVGWIFIVTYQVEAFNVIVDSKEGIKE